MRDAFGGAFMIKLGLIFLVIYISFMALALSYAKAFRVKNQIINYIEQYEGWNDTVEELTDVYLANAKYYVAHDSNGLNGQVCGDRGYCLTEISTVNGTYYLVETYMQVDFPFFNIHLTVPIRGETRVVTNV